MGWTSLDGLQRPAPRAASATAPREQPVCAFCGYAPDLPEHVRHFQALREFSIGPLWVGPEDTLALHCAPTFSLAVFHAECDELVRRRFAYEITPVPGWTPF